MDLELDWIRDTERLMSITESCHREDLPYISLVFVYIDKNKVVSSVTKDSIEFPERILTADRIKSISRQHQNDDLFLFKETFLFHIPIEPELIPVFHEDAWKTYGRVYSVEEDIVLPPSIFIFHPYNTLYFIYIEDIDAGVVTTKSIKKTKRVRFSLNRQKRKTFKA
jgi:hypothetical protein